MSRNFEIEKQATDAFLRAKGIISFELSKPQIDPPDIIADIKGKLYGIEVTALVSDLPQLILEKQFDIIFTQAKNQLTNAKINNLVIRVEPQKHQKIERKAFIDTIVKTTIDKHKDIGQHRTEIAYNPIPGISKITAYRTLQNRIIITFDSRNMITGTLPQKELQAVIEEKIKKLAIAKSNYPDNFIKIVENWLLITVEGSFYSDYAGVSVSTVRINLINSYDKIFVFHEDEMWIEEIWAT